MGQNEKSASLLLSKARPSSLPRREDAVPAVWHTGDVILDLYEVKDVFWPGAKGLVYRVHHREWNIDLAVKSPRETPFDTEKNTKDFVEAADSWVGLGLFPHIVSCYYLRMLGGIPRLFLEFIEEGSLHDRIQTRKLYEGGKEESLKRILDIAIQFGWGLNHAHEHNLIHQDVKPSNVMMTADGIAKVKGFASLRESDERGIDRDSAPSTSAFFAPEQGGNEELSRQANIWSWAASVLEMFTGELRWREGELSDVALETYLKQGAQDDDIPEMPASVAILLRQCLQSDPALRPATMAQVGDSLRQIYKHETGSDHPRHLPLQVNTRAEDLNNRALSALDFGNTDEALWLWDEALILKPQHVEATYNRGLVRWRAGRITDEDLITTLEGLKNSEADDEFVNTLISGVHLERDDAAAATESLARIDRGDAGAGEVSEALIFAQNKGLQSENQLTAFCDDEIYGPNLFSPDGKSLLLTVSGPEGPRIRIVDFTSPESARYLAGHEMLIHAIAVSADGRYALSSSEDATVRLWDVLTTECLQTLPYAGWPYPNLLGLSADASCAVLGFEYLFDGATLKLWDVKAGQPLRDFEMPMTYERAEPIYSISMSPDGKYVVSGGEAGSIKLWDVGTGKSVRTFDGLWGYVRFVQFSPDGTRLFAANSCEVQEFDVNTGACLRAVKVDEADYDKVARITVSADGRYALFGSELAELKLWEIRTGRCVRTFQDLAKDVRYTFGGSYEAFTSINLSPNGRYLLSGTRGGTYKLRRFYPEYQAPFKLSRITATEQAIENQTAAEESLALARKALAEERFIEAASHVRAARSVAGYERWGDAIELWTSLYAHLPRTYLKASWHSHEIDPPELASSISFSADGKYVLFGGHNMELKDVATGQSLRVFEKARDGNAALSGDARLAMIGGWDHYGLWDTESGKVIEQSYSSHEKHVKDIQASVDGRYAVMCTEDSFKVWSIGPKGMKCTLAIRVDWGLLSAVAISSNNKYCVAGAGFSSFRDNDYRLRLWDVESGECQTFDGYDSGTYALVFTPDNKHFLGAGFDGKLRLWDVATGECVRLYEGHSQPVDSLAISADGKFALSGGRDHTLRLWNLATEQCVRTWEIKSDFIDPVGFSTDCKYVLAGMADRSVRVEVLDWELEDRETDLSSSIRDGV